MNKRSRAHTRGNVRSPPPLPGVLIRHSIYTHIYTVDSLLYEADRYLSATFTPRELKPRGVCESPHEKPVRSPTARLVQRRFCVKATRPRPSASSPASLASKETAERQSGWRRLASPAGLERNSRLLVLAFTSPAANQGPRHLANQLPSVHRLRCSDAGRAAAAGVVRAPCQPARILSVHFPFILGVKSLPVQR